MESPVPQPAFGSPAYRQWFRDQVARHKMPGRAYAQLLFGGLGLSCALLAWAIPHWERNFIWVAPLYFVFANGVEYLLHRGPMHHRMPGMTRVYEHVSIHHSFYADAHFFFEQTADYRAALLPPYIIATLALITAAVSAGLALLSTPSQALFFALCATAYYLLYEGLHFAYHAPPGSLLRRAPGVSRLARRHLDHHQVRHMAHGNFNITFPIFDSLLGTRLDRRRPRPERTAEPR